MKASPRKKAVAALACAALGFGMAPAAARAADADLAKKLEALQQEIEALKAQMKAQAAAPAAAGSIVTAPAGLELSVYGVGHLSADSINTGTDSSGYLHSNSSRIGVKGSYDFGGGTAAIFQYESGVDLTGKGGADGNGSAAGSTPSVFTRARDSFIGLRGSFGQVVAGRLPALNQWLYDYNLFGDQVGDLGNIWGANLPGRVDSAIQYRTPDFGGFSAALAYSPSGNSGTGAAPSKDRSDTLLKLDFNKGGLKLGGAYATLGQGTGVSKQKASAITASYDFGAFNIGGGLQHETDVGGVAGRNQNESTLGAALKVGANGAIKLQHARAGNLGGVSNTGARQTAIGYDYAWNKETTLYAAYAITKNDSGTRNFVSYDWGHGNQGVPPIANNGDSAKAFSVGVVYKFDMGLIGKR
ncbi:MAG TPA: porin [Rhodocyclaceae bacterium]